VPGAAPVVLVDALNVLRSTWPNIPAGELVELCGRWAAAEGCRAVVVFDGAAPEVDDRELPVEPVSTGAESADDWIARESAVLRERGQAFRLVTSDRELRARACEGAEQVIGGGTFARRLLELRG
jgi:predicted RNA-binding protein with PIN domain